MVVVAVIAVMNLRGVRESGTAFAIPTYCFVGIVILMIIWGGIRLATGGPPARRDRRVPGQGHRAPSPAWPWCS